MIKKISSLFATIGTCSHKLKAEWSSDEWGGGWGWGMGVVLDVKEV